MANYRGVTKRLKEQNVRIPKSPRSTGQDLMTMTLVKLPFGELFVTSEIFSHLTIFTTYAQCIGSIVLWQENTKKMKISFFNKDFRP